MNELVILSAFVVLLNITQNVEKNLCRLNIRLVDSQGIIYPSYRGRDHPLKLFDTPPTLPPLGC